MPEDIKRLTMPHIKNHQRIYEAVIQKDRQKVYQAFYNDPLIAGRLTKKQSRKLADEMIDKTACYNDM